MTNKPDMDLYLMMKCICLHNIPPHKYQDKDFGEDRKSDAVVYKAWVETVVDLMYIVEEKIAAETWGKRGMVVHDGWSRFSRHYNALWT